LALTYTPTPTATPEIAPGDCNADGAVDAGDVSAVVLEVFDGDGSLPAGVPGGTFPGHPVGCNPNEDAAVDAGDLSCTALVIFDGPGACDRGLPPNRVGDHGHRPDGPAPGQTPRRLPAAHLPVLQLGSRADR